MRQLPWLLPALLTVGVAITFTSAAVSAELELRPVAAEARGAPRQSAEPAALFLPVVSTHTHGSACEGGGPGHLVFVGQLGGGAPAVAADEMYVYLASGPRILVFETDSAIGQLLPVSQSQVFGATVNDLQAVGRYVVAAVGPDVVWLTMNDSSQLEVEATYRDVRPDSFTIDGTTLFYLAQGSLHVVRADGPGLPTPLSRTPVGLTGDLAVVRGHLYVAQSLSQQTLTASVTVFDVRDPYAPREIGVLPPRGRIVTRNAVQAVNDRLALFSCDADTRTCSGSLYDVGDPISPRAMGLLSQGFPRAMSADGNLLWITSWHHSGDSTVDAFDTKDGTPVSIGHHGACQGNGIVAAHGRAYLAGPHIHCSDAAADPPRGRPPPVVSSTSPGLTDDAFGTGGALKVLAPSGGTDLLVEGWYDTPHEAEGLRFDGDSLLVGEDGAGRGNWRVNVDDPTRPFIVGFEAASERIPSPSGSLPESYPCIPALHFGYDVAESKAWRDILVRDDQVYLLDHQSLVILERRP